jgi:hypothetical protein
MSQIWGLTSDKKSIPVLVDSTGAIATVGGSASSGLVTYTATRPTLTDGQTSVLQGNTRGDQAVAEQYLLSGEDAANGVFKTSPKAIATALDAWNVTAVQAKFGTTPGAAIIKAGAGRIRRIIFANANATTGFWGHVGNKATALVATDVNSLAAVWVMPSAAASAGSAMIDFGECGMYCSLGIAVGVSTVQQNITALAATDASLWVMWF